MYIDNENKREDAYHKYYQKWSNDMEARNEMFKKNVLEDSIRRERHIEEKILKDVIHRDTLDNNVNINMRGH